MPPGRGDGDPGVAPSGSEADGGRLGRDMMVRGGRSDGFVGDYGIGGVVVSEYVAIRKTLRAELSHRCAGKRTDCEGTFWMWVLYLSSC
jgi:hypothetical protein